MPVESAERQGAPILSVEGQAATGEMATGNHHTPHLKVPPPLAQRQGAGVFWPEWQTTAAPTHSASQATSFPYSQLQHRLTFGVQLGGIVAKAPQANLLTKQLQKLLKGRPCFLIVVHLLL